MVPRGGQGFGSCLKWVSRECGQDPIPQNSGLFRLLRAALKKPLPKVRQGLFQVLNVHHRTRLRLAIIVLIKISDVALFSQKAGVLMMA